MPIPIDDDVRLPNGVMVRIRNARPADQAKLDRLLTAPDAVRIGRDARPDTRVLVAEYPWGDRIVGHAAWRREHGPRAAAAVTVAHDFARTPVAAHLLARLARLADASLVPTLVVAAPPGGEPERFLRGIGAEPAADGALELATAEWPEALARLGHLDDVPGGLSRRARLRDLLGGVS